MQLKANLFILLAVTAINLAAQTAPVEFGKQVQPILGQQLRYVPQRLGGSGGLATRFGLRAC